MLIRLTRLSNERHRFELIRDHDAREVRELETRSFLLHDLAHYAVECEARLRNGFYGQLQAGRTIDEITQAPLQETEPMQIERVVAFFQGLSRTHDWAAIDRERLRSTIVASFTSVGEAPPEWLTEAFVTGVCERMRRLLGQWRATPFHEVMELPFA